ncbi:uncharacterized protein LODBEIA_P19020 [Lodderomyces beijingensis]|uniref:Thioredoxin domain-containing protein n=1 Tax=Lodderomyces beijingensis TaxID=1775926 RepID=A0ABP0ZHN8_9ASCO
MLSRRIVRAALAGPGLGCFARLPKRAFCSSIIRLQEQQKQQENQPTPKESQLPPKKRPLSRVAIGGSQDSRKKYRAGSGLEFATWKAVVILLVVGGTGTWYFQREKARLQKQREMESNRKIGRPLIGGPFSLVDTNGEKFTEQDLVDPEGKRWSLIYFGFSLCPDWCPEEIEKMVTTVNNSKEEGIPARAIFISTDHIRDSPETLKRYLAEFDPNVVGLSGSYEAIKHCCKQFRVYFSTPPEIPEDKFFLVDHSLFTYLIDPDGKFVEVFGVETTPEAMTEKIKGFASAFVPIAEREAKQKSWWSKLV